MQKKDNSMKIKIIFLFMISNLSIYLLSSSGEVNPSSAPEDFSFEKKGYIELKIRANLLTSFELNKAISILNHKNELIVPYAQLREKLKKEQLEALSPNPTTSEYIIYLPQKYISQVLQMKKKKILPYGVSYKKPHHTKKQRSHYEITL
ncbi:MAG: hypothetical protein HON90_17435 [Halobacteriovoraceae bacterium]|nr:hypothetical protein [Halobacteriovoraceae bacterium]